MDWQNFDMQKDSVSFVLQKAITDSCHSSLPSDGVSDSQLFRSKQGYLVTAVLLRLVLLKSFGV